MTDATNLSKIKPSLTFFSEVKAELAKVVWPSKEETIRLTGIVIVISLVVGLFIGALDYILTILTGLFVRN
ncbi:preprotein translocase subunit SecE [Candidatus Gottesmanbacteria bacterium]|nr:preprotein translocase subunit SecE [Candidatus Gottesmanbacteria bacterium]